MKDDRLLDAARSLTAVIAADHIELSSEQLRSAFLRVVPALISEVELLAAMKELQLELKPKRRRRASKK